MEGVNDHDSSIEKIAAQLSLIGRARLIFLVPTRPPAESSVKRASRASLSSAVQVFAAYPKRTSNVSPEMKKERFSLPNLSRMICYCVGSSGQGKILSTSCLKKGKAEKSIITELLDQGRLIEFLYFLKAKSSIVRIHKNSKYSRYNQ